MSIVSELFESNCIKVGRFVLRNGEISKYYFDIKNLISYPSLLSKIGDEIYKLIDKDCDLICGVPIGGIPISTYISTKYHIPMIIPRKEIKKYGTQKLIEGEFKSTDKCVIIEDVITSGSSVRETLNLLKDKVTAIEVIVIIDRQQDYQCELPVKSFLTKTDIVRERLYKIVQEKNTRLCFSADIEDPERLIRILESIGKYIAILKIHYDTYPDKGNKFKNLIIDASIKYNFLIMEDRKLVDISHITKRQFKKYRNWVDMITVMASVSDDVVNTLSGVLLVANMSNNFWDYTTRAKDLAKRNSKNVIGFITQSRIDIPHMWSMTPGVSLRKKKIADQKYRSVDEIDTDIIIVGRGIYNNINPVESASNFSKYRKYY